MKHFVTLASNRIRLTMRNKIFIFFTLLMPLGMFFFFAGFVAKGEPRMVAYWLGPVISMTVMGSFWGLSINLVMYREQGILRRFRLAPVTAADMLASSIAANYILTMPTVIIEILLARWLFHVTQFGNLFSFAILVSVATVAFAALGLIVASVTNSMQETQVIAQIIWFALLFPVIPMPLLPGLAQHFIVFLPATYLVNGLHRAQLLGQNPWNLRIEICALAAWAILAFFISAQLFRWEPEEKIKRKAKLWALATIVPFLILGVWENKYGHIQREAQSSYQQTHAPGAPESTPKPAAKPAPGPQEQPPR